MSELVVEDARMQAQKAREKCAIDNVRLARVTYERFGAEWREVWHDGDAFAECNRKLAKISDHRDEIERYKKSIAKRKSRSLVPLQHFVK